MQAACQLGMLHIGCPVVSVDFQTKFIKKAADWSIAIVLIT